MSLNILYGKRRGLGPTDILSRHFPGQNKQDNQYMYTSNIKARSRNHGCNGSTTLHNLHSYTTYVAAKNMKHIVFLCGNKMQLDATDYIYCRFYCMLNMFRAILCPSSGAREYHTDGRCLWYLVLQRRKK